MTKFHVVLEDGSGDFFADLEVEALDACIAVDKTLEKVDNLDWYPRDSNLDVSGAIVLDVFPCDPETEITCTQEVD